MKGNAKKILRFTSVLGGLKDLERYRGQVFWRDYPKRARYESVADHSWRLAMMVLAVAPHLSKNIDTAKALTMALIHDIPEILCGDPSPLGSDGTGRDSHAYNKKLARAKAAREKRAAKKIFGKLSPADGARLYRLWLEFEEQKSFEAKVIRALDKIEGKIQVADYTGGRLFPEHLRFNMTYGVAMADIDPALKEISAAILDRFAKQYKEFKPRSSKKRT